MSRHHYYRRFSCVLAALLGAALTIAFAAKACAQSENADRAAATQDRLQSPFAGTSTGLDDGHAVSSPNDADLGEQAILKRSERYQPFTASVGAPFYWTSNVALVNSGEQDDFIVAPVAAIYYQPRITKTLYGLIDVREQLFYYDQFDSLNFGSFDVDVGLSYYLPQLENLILRAQYNYNRLTEKDSFDDFFSNHALILGAELPVRLGRAQQVSFGIDANISFAGEPEDPRRDNYEAYVSYSANLTRAFNVNAVGRVVVRDYIHQDSRVDISEVLSVSANYQVMKCLTASAISTFAANQSNHSVFDYEVVDCGGAVALSIKF